MNFPDSFHDKNFVFLRTSRGFKRVLFRQSTPLTGRGALPHIPHLVVAAEAAKEDEGDEDDDPDVVVVCERITQASHKYFLLKVCIESRCDEVA